MADQGVSDGLKWKHFYSVFVGAALNHNSLQTQLRVLGVSPDTRQRDQKLAAR